MEVNNEVKLIKDHLMNSKKYIMKEISELLIDKYKYSIRYVSYLQKGRNI